MENIIISFLMENYPILFLFGVYYLKKISDSLLDLKVIIAVHETEIENLKSVLEKTK